MPIIHKPDNNPLNMQQMINMPARFVPSFRVCAAAEKGAKNNLLLRLHGGLGDIVCAEPSVRYALNHFKDVKISLVTLYPGLFQHLKFEKVFTPENIAEMKPDEYLLFDSVDTSNELAAEFIAHTLMHGIDYGSLYMWRMILPNAEKEIMLVPSEQERAKASSISQPNDVLIHPGKTWKTRTFPKRWWDEVIQRVSEGGGRPVIIGGDIDAGRANTIDVNIPPNGIDLRFKLSLMESVALMQASKVLLTNDSAPLHMATPGDTWIGFVSTVKHPDHMYTLRKGVFGWRMQDFSLGRMYNEIDVCPNKNEAVRVDECDILDLLKWLPEPKILTDWALDKLK